MAQELIFEMVEHPSWLSNTYLVGEKKGGSAVIIDSGGPIEPILEAVRRHHLRVTYLLNSHHHVDHITENARLKKETGARLCAHRLDADAIDGVDDKLEDGDVINTGGLEIRLLHIPGHTAGQAGFVVNEQICFTADTLFKGSIGGTLAPGHTTFEDLRSSIVERLLSLPDSIQVAPGHSELTTIGHEREHNPFVRVMLGRDPEGQERARFAGQEIQLIVWGRDYDDGYKGWVRFSDGRDAVVPGSQVVRPRR
jgi:glyoxylase-like metal-dependent hydrolase (beta-lactamase superfamily II)